MKGLRLKERLYRWLLWLIALLFAAFLTGLGGLVIGDLPRLDTPLTLDQFIDTQAARPLEVRAESLQRELAALSDRRDTAALALQAAQNASRNARESFEGWIATRTATGQSEQDAEVLARTRELDALKASERARQSEVEAIDAQALAARQTLGETRTQLGELEHAAYERLDRARFGQELRIFGYRLALTLPLLAVAGWLFARHRKGRWWPFVWGFGLFALFAFFVELVPYLPSYGGYVRYAVGIALVAIAGVALVRAMQRYQATREAEQQQPQDDRRNRIGYEQALERMHKGVCPACERSFRLGAEAEPGYCMHCGLLLFGRCANCGTRHNAFFSYCPSCGTEATPAAPKNTVSVPTPAPANF